MKTILMILYLVVLLSLSMLNVTLSRTNEKLKKIFYGLLIGIGYLSIALPLSVSFERTRFIFFSCLWLSILLFISSIFLFENGKEDDGMCSYAGFSFLYFFANKAVLFIPLIIISISAIKSSYLGNFDEYTIIVLQENYQKISSFSIILMFINDVARFYLIRMIYVRGLIIKEYKTLFYSFVILLLESVFYNLIEEQLLKIGLTILLYIICVFLFFRLNEKKKMSINNVQKTYIKPKNKS